MSWGVFIPQQSLAASAGRGCRLVVEEVAGAGAGGVGWGRAGGKPTAPPPEAHDRRRVAQLDARAVVAVHSVRVNNEHAAAAFEHLERTVDALQRGAQHKGFAERRRLHTPRTNESRCGQVTVPGSPA